MRSSHNKLCSASGAHCSSTEICTYCTTNKMKILIRLLPLYAMALMPLFAEGGPSIRGSNKDDGLQKRHLQKSKDQPAPAPVPTYTEPGSDYGTTIAPTCIWPGVACTTDVVWIELSGQNLGTIPTEIGLLTDLGEFSY
jgi:hypothetical protein